MKFLSSVIKLDRDVSLAIHRAASSNAVFRRLAAFAASDLIWVMAGIAVYLMLFGEEVNAPGERWEGFAGLFIIVGLPWLITLALEYGFRRKRPFQAEPQAFKPIITMHLITPSFPSGHATVSSAFAVILASLTGFWWIFLPLAAIVALGRVAVGVHYASDVIFGILVVVLFHFSAVVGVVVSPDNIS